MSTRKPNRNTTSDAAHQMSGKGWYTSRMLAEQMNIDNSVAQQAIQRIERSSYYQSEVDRTVCPMRIKIISINGVRASNKTDKLWRLAIFGEQLA